MSFKYRLLFFFICYFMIGCRKHPDSDRLWATLDKRPVPEWFSEAKFGIFIHWGVYAVPAWAPTDKNLPVYAKYSEWYWYRLESDKTAVGDAFRKHHNSVYGPGYKYTSFANSFKAELFDPAQWAGIIAGSGARYVVLTSKHHEGFTLWPSKESPGWNSVDNGPHRDLVADLSKAVKNKGLKMGYYYSLYEWYNPLYKSDFDKYVDEHMIPQMKDLVTRYKPDILWADGEWEHSSIEWKSTQFLSWLYHESPVKDSIVVNDRWGKETRGKHGDFYTTEYDISPEGAVQVHHPWEECRGIGNSFGYNAAESLSDYSSSEDLIKTLIQKVSKGGNLLLDIGPAANGTIPAVMQERLADIGKWLKVNGEAIYASTVWDNAPDYSKQGMFFTKKGNDLYLLCTRIPEKDIQVKGLKSGEKVTLLGYSGAINANFSDAILHITVPDASAQQQLASNIWVFKLQGVLR